jgi:glycosyltransferase 2 family protein
METGRDIIDYSSQPLPRGFQQFFAEYFWFILKNVIGWMLIIASPLLGVAVPGPGGLPAFLIGFALVTFPGKRRLTSRVMRGRSMRLESEIFTIATATVSVLVTSGLVWLFHAHYEELLETLNLKPAAIIGICLLAFLVTWLVMRLMLRVANFILRKIPRVRRFMRPLLRKYGIRLLPSRRKHAVVQQGLVPPQQLNDEIIEFDESHHRRLRASWNFLRPWLRRALTLGITIVIFWMMVLPLKREWPIVREQVDSAVVARFIFASLMFALFLFVFRVLTWWRILKSFGHTLPLAAATRIWSTSELARYLPGSIWQVVGRVYLVKPYGVSGSICTTSQILELSIFLFANVLVAVAFLLGFGVKIGDQARPWFVLALILVPAMAFILHPKVFYSVVNAILTRIGKPRIVQRLRGKSSLKLMAWLIIGLLWQSLAVYLIADPLLELKIDWWWIVAGAYCLAWCAGFLAFLSPGGLGVRELVFVATLQVVLPPHVREQFSSPERFSAILIFLGFVLRAWTIVGEMIVTALAYTLDIEGALNMPDAPGRQPSPVSVEAVQQK